MAQVDKLNYLPNLIWFIILFLAFYFIIFSYLVPLLYVTMKSRQLFFKDLIKSLKDLNIFLKVIYIFSSIPITKDFVIKTDKILKNFVNFILFRNNLKKPKN